MTITMRNSNVYEERSLGIYAGDHPTPKPQKEKADTQMGNPLFLSLPSNSHNNMPMTPMSARSQATNMSRRSIGKIINVGRQGGAILGQRLQRSMTGFQGVGVTAPRHSRVNNMVADARSIKSSHTSAVPEAEVDLVSQHVRSQLSHDLWWIALALFVITLIETSHSIEDPATYSVFNILFEVVSAYANIGLSIGLPTAAFSFSGGLHDWSKLVMILVMLRGRHRGLPVALDRAVRLPGEDLNQAEDEDEEIRRSMSHVIGRSSSSE